MFRKEKSVLFGVIEPPMFEAYFFSQLHGKNNCWNGEEKQKKNLVADWKSWDYEVTIGCWTTYPLWCKNMKKITSNNSLQLC